MPNWSFPVVHHLEVAAAEFEEKYCAKGIALLCRGVLNQSPWAACRPYTDFTNLLSHEEVSTLEAEITECAPGDVQNPREFDEALSAEEASTLLARRQAEQPSGSSLYVKVSLSQCEGLMREWRLEEFMATSQRVAVDHPMLLRPGGFFCWAFVGEKGSGSKTHVDVMGSDAWLVVLSGRKRWALCHPADKHLVMDDAGKFADLFHIDPARFPRGAEARIQFFEQGVGDAIFVPGDAPHCVVNEDFSVSITFNFMNMSGEGAWRKNMQQVVNASNPIRTVDLVVQHSASGQQVFLRRYVTDLRAAPRNDLECRCVISKIQESFKDFAPQAKGELIAARPIGYDVSHFDHRVLYLYRSDDAEDNFREWCDRYSRVVGFTVEDLHAGMKPSVIFPLVASHYGAFPTFPPLCVLLGWKWWFEAGAIPLVSLVSQLRAKRSGPDAALGPMSVWHYSRYPWKNGGVEQKLEHQKFWCRTQLFYCSPTVDGPVSLHPLDHDQTLQHDPSFLLGGDGSSAITARLASPNFYPHFEEFSWDIDALLRLGTPVGLYSFTGDLIRGLATTFYMNENFFFFEEFVARHGLKYLSSDDLVTCGLEKILAPVLWMTSSSGIVGFTYSHTFSAVSEPNTICLSAVPASMFLVRQVDSQAAQILSFLCNWITHQDEVMTKVDLELSSLERQIHNVPAGWLEALHYAVRAKSLNDEKIGESASSEVETERRVRYDAVLRAIENRMQASE